MFKVIKKRGVGMDDSDYELLPHEKVERLKSEVERLQNDPLIKNNSGNQLYVAVEDLTKAVKRMTMLFEGVHEALMKDLNAEGPDRKIDKLLEQNQHIANGLVTLGNKLDDLVVEEEEYSADEQQELPQQQPMYRPAESIPVPQRLMRNQPVPPRERVMNPNYPSPDNFPSSPKGPSTMGEPLNVQPSKRRNILGL